jgi:hypothetical protein
MSTKYVRVLVGSCNIAINAAKAVQSIATESLWKGAFAVLKVTDRVPSSVNLLYAAGCKDMMDLVTKKAGVPKLSTLTLWKTPDNVDMINVSPEAMEQLIPGVNVESSVNIPVKVVESKGSHLKELLDTFLSKETQTKLQDMLHHTNETMSGVLTPVGDFIESETGLTSKEVLAGAGYIGTTLLYIASLMVAVKILKTNTEDPIIFTEEDVALIQRLEKERGDIIEKSLLLFGRINPVPNPQAVYNRCAALGGSKEECERVIKRATQYGCTQEGCQAPDPSVASSLVAEHQSTLPML